MKVRCNGDAVGAGCECGGALGVLRADGLAEGDCALPLADGAAPTCAASGGRDRSPRPLPINDSESAPTPTAQTVPTSQASSPAAFRPTEPPAA